MDLYLIFLLIGGIGLAAMGLMGLGAHGHDGGGLHGHAGHGGHAGHDINVAHGHGGHDVGGAQGHAGNGGHDASHHHDVSHQQQSHATSMLLQFMSPRVLFAIALGMGASGLVLKPFFGEPLLFIGALCGGLLLEKVVVQPVWNWFMRFGSNPALTLESAIQSEATVVSSFDASGHGLVAVEVDGQLVQMLATLRRAELGIGDRIRAGDTVRIEEIDPARNRCTVTRL